MARLKETDPEIYEAIRREIRREQEKIILIASENYASEAVLEAQGSVMTNKYAEGYPGKRYYGGCEFVDIAECLAIARAKEIFNAEHANVQPHSGTQANMAVYLAMLKPGDMILSMNLAHGGHLSHGHSVNFSGILFRPIFYGVHRETGMIDYDEVETLAQQHRRLKLIHPVLRPRHLGDAPARRHPECTKARLPAGCRVQYFNVVGDPQAVAPGIPRQGVGRSRA